MCLEMPGTEVPGRGGAEEVGGGWRGPRALGSSSFPGPRKCTHLASSPPPWVWRPGLHSKEAFPTVALLNSCGRPQVHKAGPPLPAENGLQSGRGRTIDAGTLGSWPSLGRGRRAQGLAQCPDSGQSGPVAP